MMLSFATYNLNGVVVWAVNEMAADEFRQTEVGCNDAEIGMSARCFGP